MQINKSGGLNPDHKEMKRCTFSSPTHEWVLLENFSKHINLVICTLKAEEVQSLSQFEFCFER